MGEKTKKTVVAQDAQDPDNVLKKAVEKTIGIVADYVEPGPRNAEETVEEVLEAVDNDEVKEALEQFDETREEAVKIAKQDTFEDHEARMRKRKVAEEQAD
jgi:hypothetical protein